MNLLDTGTDTASSAGTDATLDTATCSGFSLDVGGSARRPTWPTAVGTAVILTVVGCWGLDRGSLWGDEAVTSYAAHLTPRQVLHLLSNVDAVHGLYYAVMHVVVRIFGGGEVALRLPSVLGMAMAGALTSRLGARLCGSRAVGVLAGLVMVATPLVSRYAQDARSYALVCAAVLGACAALVAALEPDSGRRPWLAYAGLLTVAGYLNEVALLVIAAHAGTLLLVRASAHQWRRWLVSVGAAGVLVLPLIVLSHAQAAAVQRIQRPTPATFFDVMRGLFGTSAGVCAVLGGCAILSALPRRRIGTSTPALASLAVPLLVVPPVTLFLESLVAQPLFVARYLVFCEPATALLAAAGLYRIGAVVGGRVRAVAVLPGLLACLCAVSVQLPALRNERSPDGWRQNYAGAGNYIAQRARPGDAVVFLPHSFRWARLGYPRQYAAVRDVALARSPQRAGTLNGTNHTHAQTARELLASQRVWLVGRPNNALTRFDAFQLQVLQANFRITRDKLFHGVEVRCYDRLRPLP